MLVGGIGYFPYHFSDKNAEKIELLDCPFDVTFKK